MPFYYWGPAETKEDALERLLSHNGPIAVDTETIGLKGDKSVPWFDYDEEEGDEYANPRATRIQMDARTCIGVGIAISPSEAFYFPIGRPAWVNVPQVDLSPVVQVLSKTHLTKYLFNSMFDLERISEAFGITMENIHDVAIAAQVQGLPNSLDRNVLYYLGYYHTDISDILPKGKTMLDLKFIDVAFKCCMDCIDTLKLGFMMKLDDWGKGETITWEDDNALRETHVVRPNTQACYIVDRNCVPLLRRMSDRGIALRRDKVKEWHDRLEGELRPYTEYFKARGINVFSNDQIGWFLASERQHYIGLTPTKKHLKVDEEVLRGIGDRDPIAFMVLAARRKRKLKGTYFDPLLGKDRMHTHFNLNLATGRLSSHGPDTNIQNQPDKIREVYAPDSGYWSWADLEQAELRFWAYKTQDRVMLQAFRDGISPHKVTLNALFPGVPAKNALGGSTTEYTDSKSFNFALLFDSSVPTLARTTKRPEGQVQRYQAELFELYKDSHSYMLEMKDDDSPSIEDAFGRHMRIPDGIYITDDHRYKCRLNYPVQGGVASYVKRMMLGLDAMGMDFPAQVHDEIVQDGVMEFPDWISNIYPEIDMPFEAKYRQEKWV